MRLNKTYRVVLVHRDRYLVRNGEEELYCVPAGSLRYREEYPVDAILDGEVPEGMTERVSQAGFDEVYTLIGLMLSSVKDEVRERMEERRLLESVKLCIREYKSEASEDLAPADNIKRLIERIETGRESGLRSHSLTREESDRMLRTVSCLYDMADLIKAAPDYEASYEVIREAYGRLAAAHNEKAGITRGRMDNMFRFAERCWGEDKEILMAATELTADPDSVSFISTYGCDEYFRHNKGLLLDERDMEIKRQICLSEIWFKLTFGKMLPALIKLMLQVMLIR